MLPALVVLFKHLFNVKRCAARKRCSQLATFFRAYHGDPFRIASPRLPHPALCAIATNCSTNYIVAEKKASTESQHHHGLGADPANAPTLPVSSGLSGSTGSLAVMGPSTGARRK